MCSVATTHIILKSNIFFFYLKCDKLMLGLFFGTANIIEGYKRANTLLPRDTKLHIKNAFYSPKFNRDLLSFKDICLDEYHIKINNEGKMKYIYINRLTFDKKMCWKNYQSYLLVCNTHILVQLKHM